MYICKHVCTCVCMPEGCFLHPSSQSLSHTICNPTPHQSHTPNSPTTNSNLRPISTPNPHKPFTHPLPTPTSIPISYSYPSPTIHTIPISILFILTHYIASHPFPFPNPYQSTPCFTSNPLPAPNLLLSNLLTPAPFPD